MRRSLIHPVQEGTPISNPFGAVLKLYISALILEVVRTKRILPYVFVLS